VDGEEAAQSMKWGENGSFGLIMKLSSDINNLKMVTRLNKIELGNMPKRNRRGREQSGRGGLSTGQGA